MLLVHGCNVACRTFLITYQKIRHNHRNRFDVQPMLFSNSSQVVFAFVQFSIEMSILFVAITIAGSGAWKYFPVLLLLMLVLAMFALGISLALAAIAVYFHDLNYLWTIFCQLWFFGTPIVYSSEILTGRVPGWIEQVLKMNPMSGYVRSFRTVLYDGAMPGLRTMGALLGLAGVTIAMGLWVFRSLAARMPEEL